MGSSAAGLIAFVRVLSSQLIVDVALYFGFCLFGARIKVKAFKFNLVFFY